MENLFNNNWLFSKAPVNSTYEDMAGLNFTPVDIPHDWLIYDAENLYESSFGFYKKTYVYDGKSVVRLYFEGVYQDCTIYINGREAGENKYGYSSFEVNITDFLKAGENEITVLVRHRAPNSRWYSGAGIFRNVRLYETGESYLVTDGVYFSAEKRDDEWLCRISAEVSGGGKPFFTLSDKDGNVIKSGFENEFTVENKAEYVWDIASPNLLTLSVKLMDGEKVLDEIVQKTGLRKIEYKPESGFFLNDRHVKLHGVCLHHDLGALGAAFNKEAARRQLLSMQEMGANAVRTSHNMPAVEFMELCDEMGILVDSEAFDMWERNKTEYDYARFFTEWFERDVASWVRRDRNHPSVIMWSVGNEIYDTHLSERGQQVAEMLHNAVRKHDPLKNAYTTIGSNYMPWENAQLCADKVDLAGYNYGEGCYEKHREAHPDWCIYGSETTSGVKSRGIYHFPLDTPFLTHDDLQCSSLGNCRGGMAAETAADVIIKDLETEFCAGMFIWTGSDYIGEPSPYSTKNAYFGCIDTAGFKKDIFYLYQSAWTDKPVIHLLPYWDFNEGQKIDLVVFSNLPQVEVFVNGKSLGRKTPEKYTAEWQTEYEKGEIIAVGYDENGNQYTDKRHSFGDSAKIVLTAEKQTLFANGTDLTAVEISVLDKDGYPVENARDRISVKVEGARLIGFDNGDSTDYDSYKSSARKLFSGKAVVFIAAGNTEGKAVIKACAPNLEAAEITLDVKPCEIRQGVSFNESIKPEKSDEIPVRKINLKRLTGAVLTPENPVSEITAEIMPANASYSELEWSAVTNSGIVTNIAEVKAEGGSARLTAIGDGEFRLRCSCKNNKTAPEIISDFEFKAEGFGQPFKSPYEFIAGCFYNQSKGVLSEVSDGGVLLLGEENLAGYTKLDFGKYGSDEFTLKIIHWHSNNPVPFKVWDGNPESGRLLGEFNYQADFIWQTYRNNTFKLSEKLVGEHDICFEFGEHSQRIYFGGFFFKRNEKAYQRLTAADCDLIHGDSFVLDGERAMGIRNNVFLDFDNMNFTDGISKIRITGRTRHDNDSIHVHITGENQIVREIVEFPFSEDFITVEKDFSDFRGAGTVKIGFLPGCDFDFEALEILS